MVQGRSQHSSPLPSSLAPFQFWHRTTGLGPTPSSACEACNFLSIPALHVLIAELPAETKPLPWTPLVGKCSDTADRDSAVHFITLIVFPSSHRCRCRSAKLLAPCGPPIVLPAWQRLCCCWPLLVPKLQTSKTHVRAVTVLLSRSTGGCAVCNVFEARLRLLSSEWC